MSGGVQIGRIARLVDRTSADRASLPVLSISKHDGFVRSDEYFKKQVYSQDTSGYKVVTIGDFAYSPIHLDEGSIAKAWGAGLISPMYRVFEIDEGQCDPEYVIRCLRSPQMIAVYGTLGDGSVHRRRSVPFERFADLEIPLPPLPEQRRIAAILDKADALRRKRQRAVDLLDSLTQSIFLEMFGDPVTNPRGWPQQNVRDVCRVVTGNTPSRQVADHFGKAIEWIKSDNIDTSRTYVTTATEYLSESGKRVGRVVPAGSTLITCIAGSPSAIGNSCMTDREVAFNQQINALVPETVEPFFLLALMRAAKQLIQQQSSGGMTGLVNKSKLESIRLIAPDRKLQDEFSVRAKRLEAIKSKAAEGYASTSDFFASLRSRAFAGEL